MENRTHSLVKSMRRLRVSESCSHELCLAACGRIDGVVRTLQPTYDYIMGQVIVEEAGGAVRGFAGEQVVPTLDRERNRNLIAGGPALLEALVKRLT
jgi:fructose-1,6-bisphosphatase/inositol monophosphatase family enzyme